MSERSWDRSQYTFVFLYEINKMKILKHNNSIEKYFKNLNICKV